MRGAFHPVLRRAAIIFSAIAWLALAALVLWSVSGCASRGTRWVESAELRGEMHRDDVTGATTGSFGTRIYFRDGRDSKSVKPLSFTAEDAETQRAEAAAHGTSGRPVNGRVAETEKKSLCGPLQNLCASAVPSGPLVVTRSPEQ